MCQQGGKWTKFGPEKESTEKTNNRNYGESSAWIKFTLIKSLLEKNKGNSLSFLQNMVTCFLEIRLIFLLNSRMKTLQQSRQPAAPHRTEQSDAKQDAAAHSSQTHQTQTWSLPFGLWHHGFLESEATCKPSSLSGGRIPSLLENWILVFNHELMNVMEYQDKP